MISYMLDTNTVISLDVNIGQDEPDHSNGPCMLFFASPVPKTHA